MINAVKTAPYPFPLYAAIAAAAVAVVVVGIQLFPLAVDDAYITYSSARNLARIGRLVYHPTNPELNISAPLYGILLGAGAKLGLPIPPLSNAVGAVSIFGASAYLTALCYRYRKMWAALTAGLLMATSPLLWLTLGLETCFFLLLGLAVFYHFDREHYVAAAVLTACAILTRGDGALVAGLLGFNHLVVLRRRVPWNAVAAFVVVMIPVLLYLALSFGSPLPTTLPTKQAQAAVGFSGFYFGTTILQGLLIMLRGWLDQSILYFLWLPLTVLGLSLLPKSRWSWGIVAWGVVHIAAYVLLDVAPYTWYYAPLVPGSVLLAGLAIQKLTGWVDRVWPQRLLGGVLLLCLVLAQAISLKAVVSGINAEHLPAPLQEKVVPRGEATAFFRSIGEWIHQNTPRDATVAVNDVGIIGYYADRAMIDFLGILQPDVTQAVGRNDLFYTIPHYLPDYIVLGETPVIYNITLQDDLWFADYYKPLQTFSTERFEQLGGSPLVAFERVYDPAPMVEQTTDIALVPGLTLDSFAFGSRELRPGDWMRVKLNWSIGPSADSYPHNRDQALNITTHLVDNDGEVVTEASVESVGTDFHTRRWSENGIFPVYIIVSLPDDLAPGSYRLQLQTAVEEQIKIARDLTTLTVGSAPAR